MLLISLIQPYIHSQNNQINIIKDNFNFTVSANYIASSTIQLNPFSSDLLERNLSEDIGGGYGIGFSFKKRLYISDLFIGVSAQYTSINDQQNSQLLEADTNSFRVRVYESIWVLPVELSLLFNIPSFADNLRIYLGGGLGIYFGDHKRRIINFETRTIDKKPGVNIHVECGLQYYLSSDLSVILETKFRNPQLTINSEYSTNNVDINGITYYFNKNMKSKIYLDGINFNLGLNYSF